ncbi:MAG: competence protein CoiA family protein [Pseudomonadota bacterium]
MTAVETVEICPARQERAIVMDDEPDLPPHASALGDDPGMLVAALSPEGFTVHISEDAAKERQDLICPACRTGVLAVKGQIRAHHFRHRSRAACVAGTETALHMLAKRILSEDPRLSAPAVVAQLGGRRETLRPAFSMTLENVRLEPREAGVTPDLAAQAEGTAVYVEIVVTHRVDEAKRRRLAGRGISTLEIDLSRLPCAASYARVAEAIRHEAPRYWVYSRRAAARVAAMQREADAADARRVAQLEAATVAALREFQATPAAGNGGNTSIDRRRLARLGLDGLLEDPPRGGSAFTADAAVWRGVAISRFLLAACDAVAAHGDLSYRPGAGYGLWRSYPVERFSINDMLEELSSRGLVKPALTRLRRDIVECAQEQLPSFETAEEALRRLVDEAAATDMASDGLDWGGGKTLYASDNLLGRVWREEELRRSADIIDPAVNDGEIVPERVERWLDDIAGPEIRGEHAGDRLAPRLKALADLVGVFERSGAARRGSVPPDIRTEARRLGFDGRTS